LTYSTADQITLGSPPENRREKHGSAIQLFDLKVESKLPSGRK
jgi:hypothetical protein